MRPGFWAAALIASGSAYHTSELLNRGNRRNQLKGPANRLAGRTMMTRAKLERGDDDFIDIDYEEIFYPASDMAAGVSKNPNKMSASSATRVSEQKRSKITDYLHGKQLKDFATAEIKKLLKAQISNSVEEEFKVVMNEIEMKIPMVYEYEDPNFAALLAEFPPELRPVFLNFLRLNRGVRYLAYAVRESVIFAIQSFFDRVGASPLIENVVDSLIDDMGTLNSLFHKEQYLHALHERIMVRFGRPGGGLDEILDFYARQISLFGAKGTRAFFLLVAKPFKEYLQSVAHVQFNSLGNTMKEFEENEYDVELLMSQFSVNSQIIMRRVVSVLGTLSIETVGAVVTGLMIAISGLLKNSLHVVFIFPAVRKRILAYFELSMLRSYAVQWSNIKLPTPICEENQYLTKDNILDGQQSLASRRKAVDRQRHLITKEAERRDLLKISLD